MNVVHFQNKACQRIRGLIDSYVSNELLVETTHEIVAHVEQCPGCSLALDETLRIRDGLHRAARNVDVPEGLEAKIQSSIRADHTPAGRVKQSRWIAAAAAVALAAGGLWGVLRTSPPGTDKPHVVGIAPNVPVLKVGLGDHVHCTARRPLPERLPTLAAIAEDMGSEYAGLVPILGERVPSTLQLADAHDCTFENRKFIHLVFRDGGRLVSVIITRKSGESFTREGVFTLLEASGMPVFSERLDELEVSGFETRDHLAFVVSGMPRAENFQVAANIAPPVRDYLQRIEG